MFCILYYCHWVLLHCRKPAIAADATIYIDIPKLPLTVTGLLPV